MSEDPKNNQGTKCRVRLKEDPERGWKVVVDDPSCEDALKQASQNLGPHAKKYFSDRIETNNPAVEDILKKIGLRKTK
jgi:hypothetical protein